MTQPRAAPSDDHELATDPVASLAHIEDEWRALGAQSDNLFATWEWMSTWWKHFGRDRPLRLRACRASNGALVAVLPLYVATTRGARVIRFFGHSASDQLGPVCRPEDRRAAAGALGRALRDDDRWDLFIGDDLPVDADWLSATGGRRLGTQASPVVTLGTGWDDWRSRQTRNLRRDLTRKAGRLARLGTVRHRTPTDTGQVARDLDTIFELHDARWRGFGGSRAFKGREAFHHDFVQTALAHQWLRLHVLELNGRPVAALYNLRYSGAEYAYQAGRVPELASCSVGTLLHAHAIRAAADDGLREYRFLRGTEPYKQRFADRDAGLESIAVTTNTSSRAVLAAVSSIDRYPRWLRRAVPASIAWSTGGTPSWGPP